MGLEDFKDLLVIRKQIEEVHANNRVFLLRFSAQVAEIDVITLKHCDIALKFFNVFLFNTQEGSILEGLS